MNRISNWDFLFEIFKTRLSKWKASCLSLGGRVTLIKAVLESLPTYYLSLFKAPVKVIDGLEGIIRKFLWCGSSDAKKIHWVAWDTVTRPVKEGGLGLSKLMDSNIALLSKWLWRFRTETTGLWRRVIVAIHENQRCWSPLLVNKAVGGVWCSIVKSLNKVMVSGRGLENMLRGEAGDGKDIRFWLDPWIVKEPLKDVYPILFRKDSNKRGLVVNKYNQVSSCFEKFMEDNYNLVGDEERSEIQLINKALEGVSLKDQKDRWVWNGKEKKGFTVDTVKGLIRSERNGSNSFVFKWSKWVAKKCNIFMWRMGLERLPTRMALKARNCNNGTVMCGMCESEEETVEHLFCSCSKAMEVWDRIGRWCKAPPLFLFDVRDLFKVHKVAGFCKEKRNVFKGIIYVTCWVLWKARNDNVFNRRKANIEKIVQDVKTLSFLWYKTRKKKDAITWDNWCSLDTL